MDYLSDLRSILKDIDVTAVDTAEHYRFVPAARAFIFEKKRELERMHLSGAGGAAVVALYTALADAFLVFLFSKYTEKRDLSGHALIALGGYGRKELCFCSDLDIMLLHDRPLHQDTENLNAFLISFLWDIGFTVGHSVRSTDEALGLARKDDVILTSMLEARLLDGDADVFSSFRERLIAQLKTAGVKRFIRRKETERVKSYKEAGYEIYHGEPDIKNTAGGLRDYHTGLWIALASFGLTSLQECHSEGLITEEQFLGVERALDFLWRVRNQLHLDNGAPHDALTLNLQEQVASAFGYPASRGALPVELFMQDYYSHAFELHRFYREMLRLGGVPKKNATETVAPRGGKTERGLRIVRRRVFLPKGDANWFQEDPARLLEIIWYCQKQGYLLSEQAQISIKNNLHLVDDRFRISPVARNYFMAILSDPARVGATIRQMSDIGLLDRYLPEFSAVRNLIRYDSFHQYPVHEHTLRALENLAAIPHLKELGTDTLKQILPEIKNPALLALAILLHDLGKAAEGPHVEQGVTIAAGVAARFGLEPEQVSALRFLIHNHLRMTHLSQYRDLEDAQIVESFASEVGQVENLNMLYLLTFADLYAVRQGSWNDWKSALLYDLYNKTIQALKQSAPPRREASCFWQSPKARAVIEYLPRRKYSVVEDHLRLLSERYLNCFTPQEIAEHIRMIATLKRRRSALRCVPLTQYSLSHIAVCAADHLGLFARIVGAFASQQISVLHAAVFTRADGIAVDSFYVVDAKSEGPLSSTKWAVVKERLRKVLRGDRDVKNLLQDAARSPRAVQRAMTSLPRDVHFDNRVSATHTVIDVEAPDRVGLLYDIASTLSSLGLNLSVAKVTTDVRQARDAFYVTDATHEKIVDPLRLEQIKAKIEDVLERSDPALTVHGFSIKGKRRVKTR